MDKTFQKLRLEIFKRDNFTCQYCGKKFDIDNLHIDHIIPKSQKGNNKKENLTTACITCNCIKGPLNNEEFLKKAISKYQQHKELSEYFWEIMVRLKKMIVEY